MLCERCKSRPAAIQVRHTVNGQQQQTGLCHACAEELGITASARSRKPFARFPGFGSFFNDPFFGQGKHEHAGFSPEAPLQPQTESVNILDAFSDRAKGVVQKAAGVAQEKGSPALDTEHLLIGIASEAEVGRKILENLDIDADELVGYLTENMQKEIKKYTEGVMPDLSPRAKQALELAWHAARNLEHDYVGSEHILLGLLAEGDGLAAQTLKKYGITETKLRQAVLSAVGEKGKKTGKAEAKSKTPTLDEYSRDLTQLAREGKLDPVIGRSDEVQRVVQILSRRTKNNPVLIGEPGTGKTAIVEGLATRIINDNIPDTLKNKRVLSLDLPAMVAGTKYRGEFEERIKKVVEEIQKADRSVIVFIDELHTVMGAGASGEGGTMDAANILKPALARGELQMIGATTLNEYKKHIEKDGALERRFQPVLVEEPAPEDAIEILRGLKDRYEAHHKVTIADEAIVAAVTLSNKYLRDRFLPDKAIDLMDEAAAKVRLQTMEEPENLVQKKQELKTTKRELASAQRARSDNGKQLKEQVGALEKEIAKLEEDWKKKAGTTQTEVRAADVETIISSWTGIPVEKLTQTEKEKLLSLEDELHKRVIAQEEAVKAVSEAIRRTRAGLKDPKRPQGSFLFLGPTGVGKTELTKALAEVLFGSDDSMIRLDMSEYMEKHAVSRMIGSPPGYVGHEEGGQLTEQVRRRPYSVILLDEIEKAHPDIFNILLQVLEDGRLTDGKGRTVDFRNALIIMTSNVGSTMIQSAAGKAQVDPKAWEDLKALLMDKLKEVFRPEFLNRVDDTIIFHPLEKVHVQQIAEYLLEDVKRLVRAQGLELEITEEVRNRLAQDGFDPQFGARPLRREIQQRLENKLATALLSGEFNRGDHITAVLRGDDIALEVQGVSSSSKKGAKKAVTA
ncbi:MAG: ATP-dependent Clp protease ATP-binding subunit [Candidatus Andersenbacteria bacterium]